MDNITEEDKRLLETLGLQDIPEEEKKVVLEEIDEKMSRRFIANLLASMSPEKAKELDAEVQNIPSEKPQEIIEKIIEKHPDAAKVLQDSAKQIVEELKTNKNTEYRIENTGGKGQNTEYGIENAGGGVGGENTEYRIPNTEEKKNTEEPFKMPEPAEKKVDGIEEPSKEPGENQTTTIKPAVSEPETSVGEPVDVKATETTPADAPVDKSPEDKPLPVAEEVSDHPFGKDIKIVSDDEAPKSPAPEPPAQEDKANPFVDQPPKPGEAPTAPESEPEEKAAIPEVPKINQTPSGSALDEDASQKPMPSGIPTPPPATATPAAPAPSATPAMPPAISDAPATPPISNAPVSEPNPIDTSASNPQDANSTNPASASPQATSTQNDYYQP